MDAMGTDSARRSPRARRWLVVAVAALGLLAGCSSAGRAGEVSAADIRYVSGTGTVTTMPPDERQPAPDVSGTTLDGRTVALSDYAGKVVVVNVWGSWCPPCRKEAPDLVAAANHLRSDGVAFLGINVRDNHPAPARAFVRRFDVSYPSIYDPSGRQLLGFRTTLPANAIPSTLVIDAQGRVAARVVGSVTRRTIEQLATDVVTSG